MTVFDQYRIRYESCMFTVKKMFQYTSFIVLFRRAHSQKLFFRYYFEKKVCHGVL